MSESMTEILRIANENGFPGMIADDRLVCPHLTIEIVGEHDVTTFLLGWMIGKAHGSAGAFDSIRNIFGGSHG